MQVLLTRVSGNKKTGPIPVSTSSRATCPESCPFRGSLCYAESGPLRLVWDRVTEGKSGSTWADFLKSVSALPKGQLWRHNQAGDLPGEGDKLDIEALGGLVQANRGRRGFTYTHKPLRSVEDRDAIRQANANGFTVNLSANSLEEVDRLLEYECGPVVTVLPIDTVGKTVRTQKGTTVVVCPATYNDAVTCASCQLCARADRKVAVGFPVHGVRKKRYSELLPTLKVAQ